MYLKIECTQCHSLVSSKQINLALMQAECHCCGHSFPFAEKKETNTRRKPNIASPVEIAIEKKEDLLKIQLPWNQVLIALQNRQANRKHRIFNLLSFSGITAILVFLILIWPSPILFIIGLFLFLLGFYHFIYRSLPFSLNKIQIKTSSKKLEINYGRLPNRFAYGKITLPVQDILQLYIRRSKNKKAKEKNQRYYALCAVLKNRKNTTLIDYLLSPDIALFLEQEIEQFLQIKDKPVVGEME